MPVELKVPAAGESINEVQIIEWRKSEGDAVEQDEILVEIETDKATMEIPSPAAGKLGKVLHKAGEIVPVGAVLAHIDPSGVVQKPKSAGRTDDKPTMEPRPETVAADREDRKEDRAKAADQKERHERQAPSDAKVAETPRESNEKPKRRPQDVKSGDREAPMAEVQAVVMPAARRALAEYGLKPSDIRASGPGGRVLKEDVYRHVAEQAAETNKPSASVSDNRHEELVPMTMLRRRVAERLVKAQQAAALLTTFNEVDMTAVNLLRADHQEAFQKRYGIKVGFMSFFVKAVIDALKLFPQLNAEVRGTDIVYHDYYDIGVAVSTDKGLIVPVLRNAERMSFAEVERTIADLATRARDKKIDLAELEGGTFTITNGGVFGSLLSTPIINPPQSGILGLHAIQDRPVARDGQVVIRPMMYVALTYDHRIVDGREAVTFLRRIKECIEAPARMLIEV